MNKLASAMIWCVILAPIVLPLTLFLIIYPTKTLMFLMVSFLMLLFLGALVWTLGHFTFSVKKLKKFFETRE